MNYVRKTLTYTNETLDQIQAISQEIGIMRFAEVIRYCVNATYKSLFLKKGA